MKRFKSGLIFSEPMEIEIKKIEKPFNFQYTSPEEIAREREKRKEVISLAPHIRNMEKADKKEERVHFKDLTKQLKPYRKIERQEVKKERETKKRLLELLS